MCLSSPQPLCFLPLSLSLSLSYCFLSLCFLSPSLSLSPLRLPPSLPSPLSPPPPPWFPSAAAQRWRTHIEFCLSRPDSILHGCGSTSYRSSGVQIGFIMWWC